MAINWSTNDIRWKSFALLFCVAVAALLVTGNVVTAASWVKVWNNLGEGQFLRVACYSSRRGSTGPKIIAFDQVFHFNFHASGVRWWCDFAWEDKHLHQSFVVWDHTGNTEMPVRCGQCLWGAHPDGWWVWDKSTHAWKLYVRWKTSTKHGKVLIAT